MQKIRKLFGGIEMTWPKVIIMALVTAVYTALINQIPALKDTSFQDIAVNLECWILFAVFIVVNCKKPLEASLKCFVFFLISQPLIYLIEVPFSSKGFGLFEYYKYWFVITVLTLPGAAICYLLKRKDWLSVAVLSVANAFLGVMGATYLKSALAEFPHHLLSAIFCVALAVFFIFVFFTDKKHRIAALAVVLAAFAVMFIYKSAGEYQEINLGDGSWTYEIEDDSVVSVEMEDGNTAKLKSVHDGRCSVFFKNEDGTEVEYYVTVSGGGIYSNLMD